MSFKYILTSIIVAIFLAGCAVGPDFKEPAAPDVASYTTQSLPEKTASAPVPGGEEQRFAFRKDIPDQWWTLYRCPSLDKLIRQALSDNPSLAASKAALRQSQEFLTAGKGSYFPHVDANASAVRQKSSGAATRQPNADTSAFTLYNASVGVSYSLDFAGGMRRELESLQSLADYQSFELEGAYLALTSNIVTTAVQEASLRAQIEAVKEIASIQEKQLGVVERQLQLGAVSRSDMLAQKVQLAQTEALLPPLEKQLDQTRHRLSVLAGRLPGQEGLPEFAFEELTLPKELPVSLPSELVRRRPDIRASESILHSASAQVGVATANLYPQVTLSGTYGSQALKAADLFGAHSAFWNLGAGLLQPVFRGGELSAMRRAAISAYDIAESQYRQTVLLAFQDVADVLRALDADARTLKAQAEAEAAAEEALGIAGSQFSLGAASYLTLLNAQQQYQQARIGLVQAQATRFADTAALFQALGGGWWNRSQDAARALSAKER